MQKATSPSTLASPLQCNHAFHDTQGGRAENLGISTAHELPCPGQLSANISRPAHDLPMKTASVELLLRYMCGDRLLKKESEIAQALLECGQRTTRSLPS